MIELKVPEEKKKMIAGYTKWCISKQDPYNFKVVECVDISDESIDRIADAVIKRLKELCK